MLEIYPIKDKELLKEKFAQKGISITDSSAGYIAYDGGEAVGLSLFKVEDKFAHIYVIEPENDALLCDSLIRSVINYAANRGVFRLVCAADSVKAIAAKLSYLSDDGEEINVMDMMQGCKNCKKV